MDRHLELGNVLILATTILPGEVREKRKRWEDKLAVEIIDKFIQFEIFQPLKPSNLEVCNFKDMKNRQVAISNSVEII